MLKEYVVSDMRSGREYTLKAENDEWASEDAGNFIVDDILYDRGVSGVERKPYSPITCACPDFLLSDKHNEKTIMAFNIRW